MPDILLTTLNARFIHCAFGLRYLLANLGELRPRASLAEFDINQRPIDIVEALLAHQPKIIGFGIYIWNVRETLEVIAILKRLRPDVTLVLGGPEVSYEAEDQEIVRLADHVITGEADLKFAEVCRTILAGESPTAASPHRLPKVIAAELPDLAQLALPYELYNDRDTAHRIIYVEASRGCPFTCEFCLSSLDIPVRQFPLPAFLAALQGLLDRGVRQFKFVDRTFNLNLSVSLAILRFFLDRYQPGLFVHFEMIPDRLPGELREIIAQYPAGALQFEIGIQTFNPDVSQRISRRQNYERLADNFRFLRRQTGVHIHADLIFGLPGETWESFGQGFDQLVALRPQEIQVGILKRLRGTPIGRHDVEWQMVYSPKPPYEILQNRLIDFPSVQRMRHFARYWDLLANSGNFAETVLLLWQPDRSAFESFLKFSDWLFRQVGQHHGVALLRLSGLLFNYLVQELKCEPARVAETLLRDHERGGRLEVPGFLRPHLPKETVRSKKAGRDGIPKRQSRHLATDAGAPANRKSPSD